MAPKQKTFELIPDLPGVGMAQQQQQQQQLAAAAAVQSRPPMTTKQAKKLYRQKGKGPKISKAEQRRIDLMEQDRIRKEFEKEKAQARARTARDKKKAKEDKERDEKRRKGLPLVEVHPSQDTISRFISRLGAGARTNTRLGSVQEADSESATEVESDAEVHDEPCEEPGVHHVHGNPRKATGKENEDPTDALADSAERTAKRQKLAQPGPNLLDRMIHIPSQLPARPVARVAQELEMESWSRPSSLDTDDPATETMLEDQLIADVELASSKSAARSSPNRQSPPRELPPSRDQPQSHAPLAPRAPLPAPPRPPSRPQPPRPQPPGPQKLQARQLPAGARPPTAAVPQTGSFRPKPAENAFKKPVAPFIHADKQSHAARCAEATKSPAPPKFKLPSAPIIPRSAMPKFLPKPTKPAPIRLPVQASPTYAGSRGPAIQTADAFPTSTQLLVMNHVDELFPSSSQEARELREDHPPVTAARIPSSPPSPPHSTTLFTGGRTGPSDGRPSNTSVPRPPTPPSRGHPGGDPFSEIAFLATQDLILSSQDMEELDTPSKVRAEPASRSLHVASPRKNLPLLPENSTLSSDDKNRALSKAQSPCLVTAPTTGTRGPGSQCSHLPPASKPGPGPRGTPVSKTAEEATRCPTQAHIRPRSQRLQASRNGSPPSRPTSQVSMLSPQQKRSGVRDVAGQCQPNEGSGCRPPSKNSQPNSPSGGSTAANFSPQGCALPAASPPKKRMFSSSGLGAEVLVAMERSYRESLAEKRRRREELRLQARKVPSEEPAQQDRGETVEDDLIDDEIDFGAIQTGDSSALPDDVHSRGRSPATSGLRSPIRMSTGAEPHAPCRASERGSGPVASQETDYGDFDFEAEEELDVLADITWADDDLSDI